MTNRGMDPGMQSLMAVLRVRGLAVDAIANGFRVGTGGADGARIDIYRFSSDSGHALARIAGVNSGDGESMSAISAAGRLLGEKMNGIASITPFKRSSDPGDASFYAMIDMAGTPDYHETVEMMDEPDDREANGTENLLQEAVSRLETVDAAMLRQAMDALDLPRSGNVRIVLSRLFRSAVDAEELDAAVKAEAAKITRQSDIDAIDGLRRLASEGVLLPLIELLCAQIIEGRSA